MTAIDLQSLLPSGILQPTRAPLDDRSRIQGVIPWASTKDGRKKNQPSGTYYESVVSRETDHAATNT